MHQAKFLVANLKTRTRLLVKKPAPVTADANLRILAFCNDIYFAAHKCQQIAQTHGLHGHWTVPRNSASISAINSKIRRSFATISATNCSGGRCSNVSAALGFLRSRL
jgi:hypothetical protein